MESRRAFGYGLAFNPVSRTLEDLPIGLVYGTWAALGIVGIAAAGAVAFDERIDVPGAVGVLLVVAGVYFVTVVSEMPTRSVRRSPQLGACPGPHQLSAGA